MANSTDDRLRLLIERAERLIEEKKGIGQDINDVFGEAKAVGYNVPLMKKAIKLRAMSPDDRATMDAELQLYCCALGLQMELPLAVAA